MKKPKIDESQIIKLAVSDLIYKRGTKYFEQGRVFNFSYDEKNNSIYGDIEGGELYSAQIKLNNEGHPTSFDCGCAFDSPWDSCCKHVVALLKEAQRVFTIDSILPILDKSSREISHLFNILNIINDEPLKQTPIVLEPLIKMDYINGHVTACLELKVGTVRTYVVKNMKDFLDSYRSMKELEFGKGFIFNPSIQYFDELSLKIIDLLLELESTEDALVSEGYYNSSSSYFKGKQAYMPSIYCSKLLNLLLDHSIDLNIFGDMYKNTKVTQGNLPLKFKIENEKGKINFTSGIGNVFPLTSSGDFFFYENTIYKVDAIQSKYFLPFYKAFKNTNGTALDIGGKDLQRFCSEVLPVLESISQVSISESLKDRLLKEDLVTKIYFDKIANGISAVVEFYYGEEKMNPFSAAVAVIHTEKIIIRDLNSEKYILQHFEKYLFRVEKDRIYLEDENQIYDFIYNALPILRELAEVYYSESFKNIRVYRNTSFSGGVRLTENSMLEFDFKLEGIEPDELWAVLESLREKKRFYRLKNGAFLPLESEELQNVASLVEQLDLEEENFQNQSVLLPKFRALYIDSLLRQGNLSNVERSLDFKEMVQNIKEPQDMNYKVPQSLKKVLRDYQKTGYKWLKTLSNYGLGGILADDMGLGKTLEVLTFVLSERQSTKAACIVIAPTSLVYNWRDEVVKFAPELKVAVISGVLKDRQEQLKEINEVDLVVTSYALIRRDIELYSDYQFAYCFLDEAQHIKNPNTINARTVKQIKANGYFALTGTPVENSLTELWSIFDFIMPGYLMSHAQFMKKFESPISKFADEISLKTLSMHIKPFILRRMKKDVLKELPEKIETKMTAMLTDEQKKLYLAYLEKAKKELATELAQNGFAKSQIKILALLTRLRQLCCHPSLFVEDYNGDSGKMDLLLEIVDDAISSGHRILVFSQFTSMLKLISEELRKREIEYFYLDGSTKAETRGELVKDFNNGQRSIFLISLKAGGTGLNLTGADMVIHYDPWWNPAVEDQASDRAYRIGQQKVVQVIRLITEGTIEERIFELQQKKKAMIDSIIQPGETLLTKLSENEIKSLFELN